MVGTTSRLCWHDLKGTRVAIEMHRQKKKAEAQGREQEAHIATAREEEEARREFERQRDDWWREMLREEKYNIDTAHSWMPGNMDAG